MKDEPERWRMKRDGPVLLILHPSAFILTSHRPTNPHARRLHYFPQNPRKAFHRDHQHKSSGTGRVARKCGRHKELLPQADSRRPGRSSNPRDGMTPDDADDAGKHARVYSLSVLDVRASVNRPAPRTTLHAPRPRSTTANSVRRSGVDDCNGSKSVRIEARSTDLEHGTDALEM